MIAKYSRPLFSLIIVALGMSSLAVLHTFAFSHALAAGSGPGILDCKSIGRMGSSMTLKGQVPGDYEIFDLKIKSGNDEYEIKSLNAVDRDMDPEERAKLEDNGVIAKDRVITVVEDLKRGVFTVALRGVERYDLRLYALPGTVTTRITSNSKKASFNAILLPADSIGKGIRMRCTFDHSI